MTPFQTLLKASGFTGREAATYLNVKHDTLRSWATNRRGCPDSAIKAFLPVAMSNIEDLHREVHRVEETLFDK